eukprot:66976-Rhodomonas_salina.1
MRLFSCDGGYSHVVRMNAAIFNHVSMHPLPAYTLNAKICHCLQIFYEAWSEFIVKCNETVVAAYRCCGLHPLNEHAVKAKPCASTLSALFSGSVDADAVRDPTAAEPEVLPEAAQLHKQLLSITHSGDAACAPGVVVRAITLEWALKTAAAESAKLNAGIKAFKKCKGLKIPGSAGGEGACCVLVYAVDAGAGVCCGCRCCTVTLRVAPSRPSIAGSAIHAGGLSGGEIGDRAVQAGCAQRENQRGECAAQEG